jgi:hypothetical protein
MDKERKKQLKKLGKAEVARQSAEIHSALKAANPAAFGDLAWAANYTNGIRRERWLKRRLPLLKSKRLEELFVVVPNGSEGWQPTLGGYVRCLNCGSASPSSVPKRRFIYWARCECGNISWRCFGPFRRVNVKEPHQVLPVKLIGRG